MGGDRVVPRVEVGVATLADARLAELDGVDHVIRPGVASLREMNA